MSFRGELKDSMVKLLVIGNGFDLTIGVKTAYHDFFESPFFQTSREKAFQWIELWRKQERIPPNIDISEFDFNCWDLLFCLESQGRFCNSKIINWCDVERVIYDSLINMGLDSFSWELVRESLANRLHHRKDHSGNPIDVRLLELENSDKSIRIMRDYLLQQEVWRESVDDKELFYRTLLEELKKFEISFGMYIKHVTSKETYRNDAQCLVKKLVGNGGNIQIDSFNYSDFSTASAWIRHINGDNNDPIFGVNLLPEEEKERPELRYFTKSSRRLHQDAENLNRNTVWNLLSIDHAVVFGHSLNKMDYDYFYYLFALLKLNTFDVEKMGSIQFIYKNYDSARGKQIGDRYVDSVYKLLGYYESCVNAYNNHMLINMLRFSGKLKIRELDC